MDKKNTFIGLGLLAVAFLASFWQSHQEKEESEVIKSTFNEGRELEQAVESISEVKPITNNPQFFKKADHIPASTVSLVITGEIFKLENEKITATFTTKGGAIQHIAFKDYPAVKGEPDALLFNIESQEPILDLAINIQHQLVPMGGVYELVSFKPETGHILFRYMTPEGIEILRGYSVAQEHEERDPYVILHETKVVNHTTDDVKLDTLFLNLGTVPPVEGDQTGEFLNFGYYNGQDADFVSVHEFQDSSGFLGFGKRKASPYIEAKALRIEWAAMKNQFFTSVLTPEIAASSYLVLPHMLPISTPTYGQDMALKGALGFDFGVLHKGEAINLGAQCYIGPKEYGRLEKLGHNEGLIMQFGLFGFISKLLLALMTAIHDLVPNYGLTIILVTVLIKLLLWPLTAASVRSSRRMSALQGPMKALKERFKDNPQRLQQETMKLFKEYKVNPAAGCLPILVQIPIFLGLFWMLRSASELRFADFLWISDLSLPDTMAMIYGIPLNILPLLMGVTMFLQMKFSPTPSADPIQQKLFQIMPFLFLIICYNFPSGLVLYWTVQNLLTILQQFLMRTKSTNEVVVHPPVKRSKRAKPFTV